MKLKIEKRNLITNPEQWLQFAPPKDKNKQWKEGRSAKSLAEFITDKQQHYKLEEILKKEGYNLRGEILCEPEANTVLPGKGNGRNHDLLMIGNDFVVGIEAKVSESFGNTIKKESASESENKAYRIDSLAKELFGCEIDENNEDLYYQLLTGVVGTWKEALKHDKPNALFLVIVFTDGLVEKDSKAVNQNNEAFASFCSYLGLPPEGGTLSKMNIQLSIRKVEISLKD